RSRERSTPAERKASLRKPVVIIDRRSKMRSRYSTSIIASALALAVTSAFAGEIRLYERPDFQGRSLVTYDRIAALERQGFGDTASSVVVADGKWEVCTDDNFR